MRIKLNQNSVGRYNILGDEQSLAFSIKIVDDEGEILVRDGVKCVARLSDSKNPESKQEDMDSLFSAGEFSQIIGECLENCNREDGHNEAKAFIYTYIEHFDELRQAFETDKRTKLGTQILSLQSELEKVKMPVATYEMADHIKGLADKERTSAEQYRRWTKDYKKSAPQYKDYDSKAKVCDLRAEELDAEYEVLYQRCEDILMP